MINPLTDMYRKYVESTTNVPITSSMLETLYEEESIPEVQPTIPTEVQPTITAQEGGPIENAETDLETRVGPMGVINDRAGDPGPSLGGEGISDDLTMEVPEGSYILNADAVSLIGISDINEVIRDAYTIAAALGQELPADYDPQNKVPIRISNGEAVIPAPLVGVIGLDRLERWNTKGLEIRRQKEEVEKAQAEAQAAQPVTEAPPVQPQSPMQAQMGGLMGYNEGDEVDLIGRIIRFITGHDDLNIEKEEKEYITNVIREALKETGTTLPEVIEEMETFQEGAEYPYQRSKVFHPDPTAKEMERRAEERKNQESSKAKGGTIQSFKEGGFFDYIGKVLGEVAEDVTSWMFTEKGDYFKYRSGLPKEINDYLSSVKIEDTINMDNAIVLAKIIASIESNSDPNAIQDNDESKPGRGLFQFERNFSKRNQGAETAINRARNFNPDISWLSKFENDTVFDVTKLTGPEQVELFIINNIVGPGKFLETLNNFDANKAYQFWRQTHYAGEEPPSKERITEFYNTFDEFKKD